MVRKVQSKFLKSVRNEVVYNLGKLTSWLLKTPEGVVITLDKCILFPLKIIYLGVRVSLRIFLGKKRRNQSYIVQKLRYISNYFSPSFSLFSYLYKVIRFLRLGNPRLLKINVPKYNYKAYCPINKHDFINMTAREDEIIEHFSPEDGDIVVDVGAHIGRYTIISSKRVGANGKVVAIEPEPSNFEILNRNIKLNGLTNVIPLNYAVNSKQTKLKLYLPVEESGFTIYNTIMVNRTASEGKFIEVDANTLDNLLLQPQQNGISHADINWIKIDVEGAEFEVLKGATSILSKSKDIALLIEVHNLHGGTNLYRQIVEFLNVYNFKIEFENTYESGEKHVIVRKNLPDSRVCDK
jgi:FkbM family methyltransferase